MATFKRIGDHTVVRVAGKSGSTAFGLNTGDVVKVTAAGVITKCASATDVETALGAGNLVLMIALSDAVLEKEGTGYKQYYLSKVDVGGTKYDVAVPASTGTAKEIAGYVIRTAEEIAF